MRSKISLCLALTLLLGMFLMPFNQPQETLAQSGNQTISAFDLEPTVAQDWMLLAYELVRDNQLSAPEASRIYAYMAIALYESIVPGIGGNYPISSTVYGMDFTSYPEDISSETYDWISSANRGMYSVLLSLFPDNDDAIKRADDLYMTYYQERRTIVDDDVVERSNAFADSVAMNVIKWADEDGYQEAKTAEAEFEIEVNSDRDWELTRDGPPVNPHWGTLRTFGLPYAEVCDEPIRLEFSTLSDSTFYLQAREVLRVSDTLTDEQREIARFWIDTPGVTGAPSGHWMLIGYQLVDQLDLSLARTAEMFVLMNTAMADSFISAWSLKYRDNLLRPETYIDRYIRPNWAPYLQSPLFPEYPSGHSVVSGAAAEVLTTMFGQVAFTDRTPFINGHENLERSFTSFRAAADEAAISRMYGGIHYRAAIENGLAQGECIGENTLESIILRPIPQGE